MKIYNMAIIGYGGMGLYHHQTLSKTDRLNVYAAYDIDPERATLAAKNGLKAYDSLEELLASNDIDIVLCATPNNFHMDICISAMKAGKHVICEKPVAMSSDELIEMMDTSKKCGVVFTIHQNRRMDKDFLMVYDCIKNDAIGKPFIIESRVQGARGVPQGWRQYKIAGGGMLLDWGVHLIDQIMYMIDEKVSSVYAHMFSVKYPEVDDCFKLLLRFESGLSAQIDVSTCAFIELPRWYVCGERGTLLIKDWNCEGKIIRANQTEMKWEHEIVYTKAGPTKTMAPRPKETIEEIDMVEPTTDYTYFYKNLIEHIEGNADLLVKPQETLRVMKVIEAAFESESTSKTVIIEYN